MPTVFFSWQSDRPAPECRTLIENALEKALKRISQSLELVEPLRVDKDTQGVSGTPPIFDTIREKIEQAAIVVSDLTFVSERPNGEPSPNPNVLIEFGYALKCLSYRRIIAVMNAAYGPPARATLPFNLGQNRFPIAYDLPPSASDDLRKRRRDELSVALERAVRAVLASDAYKATLPKPAPAAPVKYREPLDGKARFRAKGQPLGFVRDPRKFFVGGSDSPAFLDEGPAKWLRIGPKKSIDRQLELSFLEKIHTPLFTVPFFDGGAGSARLRGADGYGCCATLTPNDLERPFYSVIFVFRDGEVWAIETLHVKIEKSLIIDENRTAHSLEQCATFLKDNLNISGPYRFVIGFEDVMNLPIVHPKDQYGRARGACALNQIEYEGEFQPSIETAASVLEPFYGRVFESCGVSR